MGLSTCNCIQGKLQARKGIIPGLNAAGRLTAEEYETEQGKLSKDQSDGCDKCQYGKAPTVSVKVEGEINPIAVVRNRTRVPRAHDYSDGTIFCKYPNDWDDSLCEWTTLSSELTQEDLEWMEAHDKEYGKDEEESKRRAELRE